MAARKIQVTKNYRLFSSQHRDNRDADLKKHRKLVQSMKLYGFLDCFPIICVRDRDGSLVVKDGQNRLQVAELLGLPVYWIEASQDFDIPTVNNAAVGWSLRDYAEVHARNGSKDYAEGLEFAATYRLPIGMAFSLLAGTTSFSNCENQFTGGEFKVRDRAWAGAVANVYVRTIAIAPALRGARFIEACMAVCRVPEFDAARLLAGAERCRELLVPYGTRDSFLDLLDKVYNYGRKQQFPLKFNALQAMKKRNVAEKKRQAKRDRGADAA